MYDQTTTKIPFWPYDVQFQITWNPVILLNAKSRACENPLTRQDCLCQINVRIRVELTTRKRIFIESVADLLKHSSIVLHNICKTGGSTCAIIKSLYESFSQLHCYPRVSGCCRFKSYGVVRSEATNHYRFVTATEPSNTSRRQDTVMLQACHRSNYWQALDGDDDESHNTACNQTIIEPKYHHSSDFINTLF
jgi:hypothetical protein